LAIEHADVSRHIRQHPLNALEVGNVAPKLPARFGVIERGFEARLGDAYGQRRNSHAALVEHAQHVVKAAAFLTEQGVVRQLHPIEMQLADLRCALSHLVFLRASRHARQRAVDEEDAHTAPARGGIGSRQHERDVGDRRVVIHLRINPGRKTLLAIQLLSDRTNHLLGEATGGITDLPVQL
jgi:hypothetical protein